MLAGIHNADSSIIKSTKGGTHVQWYWPLDFVFKVLFSCFYRNNSISNVAEHYPWDISQKHILWNINDIRAAVSEEFRITTETGLH
jgi:hypothetical protein